MLPLQNDFLTIYLLNKFGCNFCYLSSIVNLVSTSRMSTVKVFIRRDTDGQTLSLQSQTKLFRLLFPSLGDGCFSNAMSLNTNLKCSFAIECPNTLGQTTNDVMKCVHFVIVQDNSPSSLSDRSFSSGLGFSKSTAK